MHDCFIFRQTFTLYKSDDPDKRLAKLPFVPDSPCQYRNVETTIIKNLLRNNETQSFQCLTFRS